MAVHRIGANLRFDAAFCRFFSLKEWLAHRRESFRCEIFHPPKSARKRVRGPSCRTLRLAGRCQSRFCLMRLARKLPHRPPAGPHYPPPHPRGWRTRREQFFEAPVERHTTSANPARSRPSGHQHDTLSVETSAIQTRPGCRSWHAASLPYHTAQCPGASDIDNKSTVADATGLPCASTTVPENVAASLVAARKLNADAKASSSGKIQKCFHD